MKKTGYYFPYCNPCRLAKGKQPKTPEQKDKAREANKRFLKKNPEYVARLNERRRGKYQQNKEIILKRNNQYYLENKDKVNKKRQERVRHKEHTDPLFLLQRRLRGRIYRAVKNGYKGGSAIKDLGCSIEQFKQYIESQFVEGMSWDNYGLFGWHLDHVKPLSLFDLSDPEQFKQACHYSNMQPLWAANNLKKGNNYEH